MKISKGNSKLGAIPNISMSPIKSCGNCSACAKDCYALKSYRQYPATRKAWDHNFREAVNNRDAHFLALKEDLQKRRPKHFRWHVSGDILDQDYLQRMKLLAYLCPETKFLAFTKMHGMDYSGRPSNLIIRFSMWPGMDGILRAKVAGAPCAWLQDGTEDRIPKNAVKCPGSCENCKAYFFKH
jgi:hypothetical protein